jgi:hypothetical protein
MQFWLRAMQHSEESWLRAMLHSEEFFSPRMANKLCAMHSNLISIENIFNKHFALCWIARSWLSAMLHSGESWLRAVQHSTYSRISLRIQSRIQKYFRVLLMGLGTIHSWKKPEVKNLVRLSLNYHHYRSVGRQSDLHARRCQHSHPGWCRSSGATSDCSAGAGESLVIFCTPQRMEWGHQWQSYKYPTVIVRNTANLAHILPWHQEQLLLRRFF